MRALPAVVHASACDLLEAARHLLGTDTVKDAVDSALRTSLQAAERRRVDVAALKRSAEAPRDLLDDDMMTDTRSTATPPTRSPTSSPASG